MFGLAVRPTADATGGILISWIGFRGCYPMTSVRSRSTQRNSISLQPLRRLPDEAQIGVCPHVDRPLEEAEVALHVNVGLQRCQIGQQIRATRIFLVGEEPASDQLRAQFVDPRPDMHCLAVILWIE